MRRSEQGHGLRSHWGVQSSVAVGEGFTLGWAHLRDHPRAHLRLTPEQEGQLSHRRALKVKSARLLYQTLVVNARYIANDDRNQRLTI